mmetsp:Transcript_21195/g.45979  ORF Transcript_21195/g.45979 Transcript_21195/m.45979 type:complete len:280 (+) Transcript_21195:417-1256(+)
MTVLGKMLPSATAMVGMTTTARLPHLPRMHPFSAMTVTATPTKMGRKARARKRTRMQVGTRAKRTKRRSLTTRAQTTVCLQLPSYPPPPRWALPPLQTATNQSQATVREANLQLPQQLLQALGTQHLPMIPTPTAMVAMQTPASATPANRRTPPHLMSAPTKAKAPVAMIRFSGTATTPKTAATLTAVTPAATSHLSSTATIPKRTATAAATVPAATVTARKTAATAAAAAAAATVPATSTSGTTRKTAATHQINPTQVFKKTAPTLMERAAASRQTIV